MSTIAARIYPENNERDVFVEVQMNDGEVDIHFAPRTDDVVTASLSAEDAWRLVRDLATAAALAEQDAS